MNQMSTCWLTLLSALLLTAGAKADDVVQFNRDVRPILSDHCFRCHGPDSTTREGDLRLDVEKSLFAERKDGAGAIVERGRPTGSSLYRRIVSTDPDERMPPPKAPSSVRQTVVGPLGGQKAVRERLTRTTLTSQLQAVPSSSIPTNCQRRAIHQRDTHSVGRSRCRHAGRFAVQLQPIVITGYAAGDHSVRQRFQFAVAGEL